MKEHDRKRRNEDRMWELYPSFRTRLIEVISALETMQIRPRIQDAWRSPDDQRKAYLSGHSKLLFGFHNVTGADGTPEALAVDLLDDDNPLNPSKSYLLHLASAAEKAGLITGIRWGLPAKLVPGIDAAIARQDWFASIKLGWDPTHVQPNNFTVADARAGKRPA